MTNESLSTSGPQNPSLDELEDYTLQPSRILMGHRPRPEAKTAAETDARRSWVNIQRGLNTLESICEQRVQLLERTREDLLAIAARIAEHIATAGLVGELLPRGYRVFEHENSLYFVKSRAHERFTSTLQSDELTGSGEAAGSYLVFSNQSSLFTRMKLKAQPLRICDLALLCNDLQHGLVDEIAEFVSASLGQMDDSAPALSLIGSRPNTESIEDQHSFERMEPLGKTLEAPPPSLRRDMRKLQLQNVGRRSRSRSEKRTATR